MSKSLWQFERPMRGAFFFFPSFFVFVFVLLSSAEVSSLSQSHLFSSVKYGTWFFGWTRYNTKINQSTEFKKFVVPCALLCLSYILMYILEEKRIKKGKKLKAWILLNQTHTKKQMHAAALRHTIFLALPTYLLRVARFSQSCSNIGLHVSSLNYLNHLPSKFMCIAYILANNFPSKVLFFPPPFLKCFLVFQLWNTN